VAETTRVKPTKIFLPTHHAYAQEAHEVSQRAGTKAPTFASLIERDRLLAAKVRDPAQEQDNDACPTCGRAATKTKGRYSDPDGVVLMVQRVLDGPDDDAREVLRMALNAAAKMSEAYIHGTAGNTKGGSAPGSLGGGIDISRGSVEVGKKTTKKRRGPSELSLRKANGGGGV